MFDTDELEDRLFQVLGANNWLGEYTVPGYESPFPAIHIGNPPPGTRRTKPGIECVIEALPLPTINPYGGRQYRKTLEHTIYFDLWQPYDLERGDVTLLRVLKTMTPALDAVLIDLTAWSKVQRAFIVGRRQADDELLERAILRVSAAGEHCAIA